MSKRWGSDYVVTEHRDLQANTMAVDLTGSYVLLAGRRCYAVKNLNDAMDGVRKFQRQSKYEVGSAEWNPTLMNCHLCAISSNTRVEILSFAGGSGQELQTTHSLRAHTRVVSDLNWHPKEPDIIASCSIDTFIHIWDIRDQRRPCLSLSAVAGSSQVRWNALSPHTLATAHDGDIKIWDQRKGNSPVQYIAAHLTKIHGLDWCPFQHNQLATSSQDCTVKIFDITIPRKVESILTTDSPVWRARYTPFGEGLVTIVVPQLRRGENSLLLWNTSNLNAPIYTFVGHTDVVLEFQWRSLKTEINDYELITWSKDQCLRIFKIDPFLKKCMVFLPFYKQREIRLNKYPFQLCGHEMDDTTSVYTQYSEDTNMRTLRSVQQIQVHGSRNEPDINCVTSKLDGPVIHHEVSAFPDGEKEVPSPTQPKTLQQEFSLINMNIPNIEVNAMDALERSCTVTACNKNYNVILKVNFPGNYPRSAQPTFQFCPGTTVDNATMAKLLKVLKQTAQQRVRKNRSCLEPCLRQLIITLEQTCVKDESDMTHSSYRIQRNEDFLNSTNICTNYQDTYIPFPRTSGAKFSCVGTLVCFGRSSYPRRASIKPEGVTPRALSALGTGMVNGVASPFMNIYSSSYGHSSDTMSISSFYFQDRKRLRKILHGSNRSQNRPCYNNHYSMVTIYDASSLFFVSKDLAEKYVINITDIPAMCQYNANVAATLERPDLVQAWCLAALVISQPLSTAMHNMCQTSDIDAPWPLHPFGQNLIHSLIQHYASQSDIQMAGMLSCAFSYRSEHSDVSQFRTVSKSVNVSVRPYHSDYSLHYSLTEYPKNQILQFSSGGEGAKFRSLERRLLSKEQPGSSPYHTIHPADTSLEGWNFQNLKQHRSNSWSESLDDLKVVHDITGDTVRNIRLPDERYMILYDGYKKAYAEVLHRWRLLDARAQVLKHVSGGHHDTYKDVEFQSECHNCDKVSRGPQCANCKRLTFQCVICHISVRGPSNFCIACGHGGHTSHLAAWFTNETLCPTGCGCCCIQESSTRLKV